MYGRGSVFLLEHKDAAICPLRDRTQMEQRGYVVADGMMRIYCHCWAVIMCIMCVYVDWVLPQQ